MPRGPSSFGLFKRRLAAPVRRVYAARWLRGRLAKFSEPELDGLLGRARMAPVDLLTRARGKASYRRLMSYMLLHFGIDPEQAIRHDWPALCRAESRCADCRSRDRCRRWIGWQRHNDAPMMFCPNAALFQALAIEVRAIEAREGTEPFHVRSPLTPARVGLPTVGPGA